MIAVYDPCLIPTTAAPRPQTAPSPKDRFTKPVTRVAKTQDKHLFRRLNSERQLEECLDWEFEPGTAYHVISGGDICAISYLRMVLRQQPLHYCAFSTWCMKLPDVQEVERMVELGRIKRLDSYVGEIFKAQYAKEYSRLIALHKERGGRVCIFRNHSKTIIGFGPKFDFLIESSANINDNPRTENTVITINTELALFYNPNSQFL